jgi:hypothetical protein
VVFKDADDHELSLSALAGDVVVLFGGGQGAAVEGQIWGKAFSAMLTNGEDVHFLEVAFVGDLTIFVPKKAVK